MLKLVKKQFLVTICVVFICLLVLSFSYRLPSFQLSPTHWISQIKYFSLSRKYVQFSQPELNPMNETVDQLFGYINGNIPDVNLTDENEVTCGAKSRATIVNHISTYCVGDPLTVRVEMFDFGGKKKTYGGDFLGARIFSPELQTGASGRVEDFNNRTYHFHFTLFWEGLVKISIVLLHPSEAVATLWKVRNIGYQYIAFTGKFLNKSEEVHTECGFYLKSKEELCQYVDEKYGEFFNCIKPAYVACEAFISLNSRNTPVSYLTQMQRDFFARSSNDIEIPKAIDSVEVLRCKKTAITNKSACDAQMSSLRPSGYFYRNQWYPAHCSPPALPSISSCLAHKMIYFMGDSTLRQWIEYLPRMLKSLKYFDLHGQGIHRTHLALDLKNNIYIQWKKHGHPFVTHAFYNQKDHAYIANEIDRLAGSENTVVVITLGQHFRAFPVQLYSRRLLNIRRAIENLFFRSPDTEIIIKSENTREINIDAERFSDFHGYIQYLLMRRIFTGLNVKFIDAWDMTVAYGSYIPHPSDTIIRNQINLFVSYIC